MPKISAVFKACGDVRSVLSERYDVSEGNAIDFGECKVRLFFGDDAYFSEMENLLDFELSRMQESCETENLINLIKIIEHWKSLHDVEISSGDLEKRACEFMKETYHDEDSYLLYGFMIMNSLKGWVLKMML